MGRAQRPIRGSASDRAPDDARAGQPGRDGGAATATADCHRPPCPDFWDENNNDAQCWRGPMKAPALLCGVPGFLQM